MLIPLSEYLDTTCYPDCEWVEGELRERSQPGSSQARVQTFFTAYFTFHRKKFGVRVSPELRMLVMAERVQIPNVMVIQWMSL